MSSFHTLATSLAQLTYLGCEIAVLVIIATVVKRNRPDAYGGLLTWSIASLVAHLFSMVSYPLVGFVLSGSSYSTDSYLTAMGAIALGMAAVHVALVLVLIKGLVALAQPPKMPVVPSAGTYR